MTTATAALRETSASPAANVRSPVPRIIRWIAATASVARRDIAVRATMNARSVPADTPSTAAMATVVPAGPPASAEASARRSAALYGLLCGEDRSLPGQLSLSWEVCNSSPSFVRTLTAGSAPAPAIEPAPARSLRAITGVGGNACRCRDDHRICIKSFPSATSAGATLRFEAPTKRMLETQAASVH